MSRAFVKEDDAGEAPIIPSRAALPPNTPNYITPRGLAQLRTELLALELERTKVEANREDEANRTRQLTIINAQIKALTGRIATAKVIDLLNQPVNEVRFGATVTLQTKSGGRPGTIRQFTIVGVDEANIAEGRIAFVAPIARALQSAKLNQTISLSFGRSQEEVEITAISYDGEAEPTEN